MQVILTEISLSHHAKIKALNKIFEEHTGIIMNSYTRNHVENTKSSQKTKTLTSTGIVSPGKTNTVSPIRISSVGTSTHIASEHSTESAEESLSGELTTKRD